MPQADWIFFLSPSGVDLFASKFHSDGFKIGVIGPGTARAVEAKGWKVSFLPKSTDPEKGINEFSEFLPTNETVIMACSDKSLKRMHGIIPANRLIEWEFYENVAADEIIESQDEFLIFTSPSNATAYLERFSPRENQVLVAIGKTTFNAIKKRRLSNEIIRAQDPTEESIWQAILNYRHSK